MRRRLRSNYVQYQNHQARRIAISQTKQKTNPNRRAYPLIVGE